MIERRFLLALCLLSVTAFSQSRPQRTRANLPEVMGFEGPATEAGLPAGWTSAKPPIVSLDTQVVHGGKQSVRIERTGNSPNRFSPISVRIPVDFHGRWLTLRGYLRVENVKGNAALWLREDAADGSMLQLRNGDDEKFSGTQEWQPFSLKMEVDEAATSLVFGAYLQGTGKAWVDDLELLVDGEPIQNAPFRDRAAEAKTETIEPGPPLPLSALSDLQVENLATLAEVWGFLKYHHPAVTATGQDWDAQLLRTLPDILNAKSIRERNALLLKWIDSLGPVSPCTQCAVLEPAAQHVLPDIAWLHDTKRFGPALSQRLEGIYANRSAGPQFYVRFRGGVGNPIFLHEASYAKAPFPDARYQLLTLFRWWSVQEWWNPDRNLLPDLHATLRRYVRPMALARDKHPFVLQTMKLIGEGGDSHANLWSSLNERPPIGKCKVPADLRFIAQQPVVWNVSGSSSQLKRGDVVTSMDGKSIAELVKEWSPFYAASNQAARLRDIADRITVGACGAVSLGIVRDGQEQMMTVDRVANQGFSWRHDQEGETFRLLSKDVAYLKLSSVKSKDVPAYLEKASGTKGLIVDIRNYPSDFVVFTLGQSLVTSETNFVHFTKPDAANPGAFRLTPGDPLKPQSPHYGGKVVILVDEVSQSNAEYTTMALRSAPGAVVVGSQTAGADGDVSEVPLPYGLRSMISGIGVLTPQDHETQQIGIARDVEAVPTAKGIAANRDEVLEVGIRQILGANGSQAEIEQMALRR